MFKNDADYRIDKRYLNLREGDIIYANETEYGDFYFGKLDSRYGFFPKNYVEELKSPNRMIVPMEGWLVKQGIFRI